MKVIVVLVLVAGFIISIVAAFRTIILHRDDLQRGFEAKALEGETQLNWPRVFAALVVLSLGIAAFVVQPDAPLYVRYFAELMGFLALGIVSTARRK